MQGIDSGLFSADIYIYLVFAWSARAEWVRETVIMQSSRAE